MVKATFVCLTLCLIGTSAFLIPQQDEENRFEADTTQFMMQKLDSARQIVGGLALEDHEAISKAAQDLLLLSHESDWNVVQTESYLKMSQEFRESTSRLRDAANDKNIDGATLAYFEVTLNCIRCHKYIRSR